MKVFNIPAHANFLRSLAAGVIRMADEKRIALEDFVILLPNRRSCSSLAQEFLQQSGRQALLLPKLTPLGDIDGEELQLMDNLSLPSSIPVFERSAILAQWIKEWFAQKGETLSQSQCWGLAESLGDLLHQIYIEDIPWSKLSSLVDIDYAAHWQEITLFLDYFAERWEKWLEESKLIDPARRELLLLRRQAEYWANNPPAHPIIAAGSTGSVHATADLLNTIAKLSNGQVILAGLDKHLDSSLWKDLPASHPQFYLARLLSKFELLPGDVADWPYLGKKTGDSGAKELFWSAAMRPQSEAWSARRLNADCAAQITRIDTRNAEEEARVIALLLRETLEEKGKTAALVTPDMTLSVKVAALLRRFGLEIENSAGQSLARTGAGRLLSLSVRLWGKPFRHAAFLAFFKHPLVATPPSDESIDPVLRLEKEYLRSGRQEFLAQSDYAGLLAALERAKAPDSVIAFMKEFLCHAEPMLLHAAREKSDCRDILQDQMRFLDALSQKSCWLGRDGEAALKLCEDLLASADKIGVIGLADYGEFFETILQKTLLRPQAGEHPLLKIWGPLESRLQSVDRLILSGLNEGVWPPRPDQDPWMSRQMREDFGLTSRERRIGQSAHDFVQGILGSKEVFLTRAARQGGQPMVESRFLSRFDALLNAQGMPRPNQEKSARYVAMAEQWNAPQRLIKLPPPRPSPAAKFLPKQFSYSAADLLRRDPYAFYGKYILCLKPLAGLNVAVDKMLWGTLVHEAVKAAAKSKKALSLIAAQTLSPFNDHPAIIAFYRRRLESVLEYFLDQYQTECQNISKSLYEEEAEGIIPISASGRQFDLYAKLDRLDILKNEKVRIVDYKTGELPTEKSVLSGSSAQLALQSAVYLRGGISLDKILPIEEMAYYRLNIDPQKNEAQRYTGQDFAKSADEAIERLKSLIESYCAPGAVYFSEPFGSKLARNPDYRHLSRILEWGSLEDAA